MSTLNAPIAVGRCLINNESISKATLRGAKPWAGVRIIQPSGGGSDGESYIPAADVYLFLRASEAQELAAYFSSLARNMAGVEA